MSDIKKEEVETAEFSDELFDSMLHGTFEPETVEEEDIEEDVDEGVEDEDVDAAEDSEDEDDEDQEDTDQEDELDDDEDLDEDSDGDLDEDSDEDGDDEEEDSLVEDDDLDDEDGDTEDEDEDADEADDSEDDDADEGSEDDADTEDSSDGESSDTDKVDYKAFYDAVVNTEFVVNGRKTKGFADPQKIIQSQQMAGGFSEKMAGFKQYRPFMSPLKERGMLEDQAKFDLAMNLVDGDREAIKQHLKSLDIDPIDLDMDAINYAGKSNVATPESLVIEDTMERAKSAGIEDRVRQVIGNEWDNESFQEFVSNDAVRNDLLDHIQTGAYEAVQEKMSEMSRLDYNGAFGGKTTIAKYRAAVGELQKEAANAPQEPVVEKAPVASKPATKKPSVKAEKAKIEKARKEEEYKEKAAKREAKVAQQRKRASSMSKKKPKAKAKAKFDPMALEGDEFDKHMDFLISGGRS